MLTTYTVENGGLAVRDGAQDPEAIRRAVWIDLLSPSQEEEKRVQAALRLEVPTREEMQEIESSSRLYREGEALFLTANFLYGVEGGEYGSTAITFVLGHRQPGHRALRHARAPSRCSAPAARGRPGPCSARPDAVMLHLFEQVVDRLADILERIGSDMDRASQAAFRTARAKAKATAKDADLKETLITLGQVGEVTTRASETLLGLSRILSFISAEKSAVVRKENQGLIKTLVRDVRSLVEHANFLNSKANFLLDAVLGIINVEQNAIIKTFTVASVALMPPTLIASVYGMNFDVMPELRWTAGLPLRPRADGGLRRGAGLLLQAEGMALRPAALLAAAVAALAATAATAAAEPECPPTRPRVSVALDDPDPSFDASLGMEALRAEAGGAEQRRAPAPRRHHLPGGMAERGGGARRHRGRPGLRAARTGLADHPPRRAQRPHRPRAAARGLPVPRNGGARAAARRGEPRHPATGRRRGRGRRSGAGPRRRSGAARRSRPPRSAAGRPPPRHHARHGRHAGGARRGAPPDRPSGGVPAPGPRLPERPAGAAGATAGPDGGGIRGGLTPRVSLPSLPAPNEEPAMPAATHHVAPTPRDRPLGRVRRQLPAGRHRRSRRPRGAGMRVRRAGADTRRPTAGFAIPERLLAIHGGNVPRLGPHIITGPVAVRGAEPGDCLRVEVEKIELGADWGFCGFRPLVGTLPEDFPYRRVLHIPVDRGRAHLHGAGRPRASPCRSRPSSA